MSDSAQQQAFFQLLGKESASLWSGDDYKDTTVWDTICSRFISPTTWTDHTLETATTPLVTCDTPYILTDITAGVSRKTFCTKMTRIMKTFEDAGTTQHSFDIVKTDSKSASGCDAFSHLLDGRRNIQKINSDVEEPGSRYLYTHMSTTTHQSTILPNKERNLGFLVSPVAFETRMHNDETDSLVYSFGFNTCVKMWMFLPDGTSEDVDHLNQMLFGEKITDSLLEILKKFPTLQLALQLPGWSIFNPFHSSHAVFTRAYGQARAKPFIGIGEQRMSLQRLDSWCTYLSRMVHEQRFDSHEIIHLLVRCIQKTMKPLIDQATTPLD